MPASRTKKPVASNRIVSNILILFFVLVSRPGFAQGEMYITDQFEVTMRSGTSTAKSIIKVLKSGEAVNVLEADLASQYSLVESSDGKKGYVLSRFLDEIPSARERLEKLQVKSNDQTQTIEELSTEIAQLKSQLENAKIDNDALKTALVASESELANVRDASENALSTLAENDRLNSIVTILREEKEALANENTALKDTTQIDWFIRGGVFFLIAFLLGIIVTRIRWRKQDSWGSY
jgi:SH3 domain protein